MKRQLKVVPGGQEASISPSSRTYSFCARRLRAAAYARAQAGSELPRGRLISLLMHPQACTALLGLRLQRLASRVACP